MKKTLVFGVATAAVIASLGGLSLAYCRPEQIYVECLYGPPPAEGRDEGIEVLDASTFAGEEEPVQDPDDIDDPVEDLYGPPISYDVEDDAEPQPELNETVVED